MPYTPRLVTPDQYDRRAVIMECYRKLPPGDRTIVNVCQKYQLVPSTVRRLLTLRARIITEELKK